MSLTSPIALLWMVAALLLAGSRAAFAQSLAASGSPGLLRINAAIAGFEPTPVSNSMTTYTVTTPSPNRIYAITAQLNAPMPPGATLAVTLAAPPGATSLGAVTLDATARDVVTGIPRRTNSTQGITYDFSATVLAGVVPSTSRTVTLTLVLLP